MILIRLVQSNPRHTDCDVTRRSRHQTAEARSTGIHRRKNTFPTTGVCGAAITEGAALEPESLCDTSTWND